MQRRSLIRLFPAVFTASATAALLLTAPLAHADEDPNALIGRLTNQAMEAIRNDPAIKAGEFKAVMNAVDRIVMPNVNFRRMVASGVGPAWRRATPAQQQQLQDQFKTLIVTTYSGALKNVNNQRVEVLPMRGKPADDAMVRTRIHTGNGEPIQVDYRLERTAGQGAGWKVYDLNVAGVWMVENYRTQFASVINTQGIDGLIQTLVDKNKANLAGKS